MVLDIVAFRFVWLLTLPLASISSAFSSITSPSYTSLVSLIRSPMDLRKFSISTSVFFTSLEYTSLATRGVKGTCSILRRIPHRRGCKLVLGSAFMTFFTYCVVGVRFAAFCLTLVPSSCAIPRAKAVFPVPGAPASSSALPAIFFCRMRSTTSPHASLAVCCPTNPLPKDVAVPSSYTFRPVPRSRFPSFSTHARTHARGSPSHDACTCFVVVSFHARVDRCGVGSVFVLVTCLSRLLRNDVLRFTWSCISLHHHHRHEWLPFHVLCPRRRHGRVTCAFLSGPTVLRCHLVGRVSRCVIAVRLSHLESQSTDVGVGGHALLLSMAMRRGHLLDAHHRHATHKHTSKCTPSHSLTPSLFLTASLPHSLSLSHCLSPSLPLPLSPSLPQSLSLSHSLSQSLSLSVPLSLSPSVPLSLSPSIPLPLSLSLPFSRNIVRFRYKLTLFIDIFCNHSSNISKIFSFSIPIPLSRTENETGENEMPKFMEILY